MICTAAILFISPDYLSYNISVSPVRVYVLVKQPTIITTWPWRLHSTWGRYSSSSFLLLSIPYIFYLSLHYSLHIIFHHSSPASACICCSIHLHAIPPSVSLHGMNIVLSEVFIYYWFMLYLFLVIRFYICILNCDIKSPRTLYLCVSYHCYSSDDEFCKKFETLAIK